MRHKKIRNSQPNLYIIYNNICTFVRYVTKKLHHLTDNLYQQVYHHTYILPLAGLGILSFLGINLLNPNTAEATYATDEGIMLTANTATPTATLSVSNSGEQRIDVQPGSGTVYSNHIISMSSVNIASYALTISGPANLSSASGKTTITGANGATGSSMGNNTWGYSYNKNGIISDNNAVAFTSFSGSNQSLESGSAPSTTQKSLVLAVKFADDAEAGHYTGAVSLSLTATPKTLTTYSITYNANNGSGAPSNWSDSSYDASYSTTISSTTPTRSGYNFLGWSTSSSASSASYSAGQLVTLSSSSPTLNLYAVWQLKSVTHYLTLNANSGSGGPGSQSCTATGTSTTCSITISNTKPTRSGYTFQGWGTSSSTSTVSYNPGSSISMSGNKTLYAVWKKQQLSTSFPSTLTTMQGMTPDICSSVAVGTSKTLTDTRDNNTYTVKKLSDEKCWMMQNLKLAGGAVTSPNDTDLNPDPAMPNLGYTANTQTYTLPPATTEYTSSVPTGKDKNGVTIAVNHEIHNDDTHGMYYSWCAATAGTCQRGRYSAIQPSFVQSYDAWATMDVRQTVTVATGENAASSICPRGWRLPTGGSSGDFQALYDKGSAKVGTWSDSSSISGYWIGGAANSAGATFFPAAGIIPTGYDGDWSNWPRPGISGFYWASTVSPHQIYSPSPLVFRDNAVVVSDTELSRSCGAPIRCVAR